MRPLVLGLLLVTVSLVGCLDGGEQGPTLSEPTALEAGTLLTYEIEQDDQVLNATFVVQATTSPRGYLLHPWNVSERVESPYLDLRQTLTPRAPGWEDVVSFPLHDGQSYPAEIEGTEIDVEVTLLEEARAPFQEARAFQLVGTDEDGEQVVLLEVLANPTVLARIETTGPNGTPVTWTLTGAERQAGWNQPPAWELGTWWTYDGAWRAVGSNDTTADRLTLIFTGNQTGPGGSPLAVLDAQHMADRITALPFHIIRKQDLASQSGITNNLLSKQWDWPLNDGKQWGGTTLIGQQDVRYTATSELVPWRALPDGTFTTSFVIEATLQGQSEPFATWDYSPRVGYFTELFIQQEADGQPNMAWELLDFGEAFNGTLEVPRQIPLYSQDLVRGPTTINETFEVGEQSERIQVDGHLVRQAQASPNSTAQLFDPTGEPIVLADPSDLAGAQAASLGENLGAIEGTWRFQAELTEGTSMVLRITGIWADPQEVDYR